MINHELTLAACVHILYSSIPSTREYGVHVRKKSIQDARLSLFPGKKERREVLKTMAEIKQDYWER